MVLEFIFLNEKPPGKKIMFEVGYILTTFDPMKFEEIEYATERRRATVNVEISVGWESDVHFSQNGSSFNRNSFLRKKHIIENFRQYVYELIFFELTSFNHHLRPN